MYGTKQIVEELRQQAETLDALPGMQALMRAAASRLQQKTHYAFSLERCNDFLYRQFRHWKFIHKAAQKGATERAELRKTRTRQAMIDAFLMGYAVKFSEREPMTVLHPDYLRERFEAFYAEYQRPDYPKTK